MEYRNIKKSDLTEHKLAQISGLIYDTDPYIYPAIFRTREDAVQLLSQVIIQEKDRMFSARNLYVGFEGENVIALILWNKGTMKWDADLFESIAKQQEIVLADSFGLVRDNYFAEYDKLEFEDVITLINVCVDKKYRSQGVGEQLMKSFLHNKGDGERYELYSLKNNDRALKLYEKMGFRAVTTQKAFTVSNDEDVYSVKMIR